MKAKEYRKKIKELILEENLLLPDFQRDFVWKPQEQQLKLACSLFLDIPIGSILVLDKLEDLGIRKLCYKEKRENENITLTNSKLLMDGQQRISTIKSIFSNLYDSTNEWKNINDCLHNNLRYRWFLNLSFEDHLSKKELSSDELERKLNFLYNFCWNKKFEDYDIEDIESFILNKKVKNKDDRWHPAQKIDKIKHYCIEENILPLFLLLSDFSKLTPIIREVCKKYIGFLIKKQYENPVINPIKKHLEDIKNNFNITIDDKKNKDEIVDEIETNVLNFFNNHIIYKEIYGVEYEKSQLHKAIVAFNTMNTGGISLGVFDIVSAKYSGLKEGKLSQKLLEIADEFIEEKINDSSVKELIKNKFIRDNKKFSKMYLNMLSIFKEEKLNKEFKLDWIKQKSLLKISAKEIKEHSEKAVASLVLAFQFLIKRCGVPSIKHIKYELIVIPIAYNLYKNQQKQEAEDKIEYSYWMSLFSGKYEKGQNAFSIEHLKQLIDFIKQPTNNPFNKYEADLCNKKGYSDLEGFKAFYEDNSYSYSSNIGEYFLQFMLSYAVKNKTDIFIHSEEKKIKIEHFENLHQDHIIPSSWIKTDKNDSPVHSVLNKFYSPSKRNRKRVNNAIDNELEREGMKILCINTQLNYKKEEFNSEDSIKRNFLNNRFEAFKKTVEKHLKELENNWK